MPDVQYQYPMQLMELLGLRGWEASQPRTYWGLKRPDDLPADWYAPNAGLGGATGWGGYQGGYGATTGGGGGFGSAAPFGGGAAPLSFSSFRAAPQFEGGGSAAFEPGSFSDKGVGLNAESPSLGDWLSSLATGPTGAMLGIAGQIVYNGLTGQPNRPITQANPISIGSLLGRAFGTSDPGGNVTGTGQGIAGTRGDQGIGSFAGFGGSPEIAGRSDGGYQGPGIGSDIGNQSAGDFASTEGPGSYGGLAHGGIVTPDMLGGPNPPGPDDGLAYLDIGEGVLTRDEIAKLGGPAGFMRLRDLLRR